MRSITVQRTVLWLALAGLLSACSFSLAEDIAPPPGAEQRPPSQAQATNGPLYPLVPPNPANGEAIYTEKCAPCHGTAGKGDGPQAAQLPNPVTAIGTEKAARPATPADWYTQVTKGNLDRFMPPFGSLSDRQRWDVVAYAFSLSMPAEVLSQGEEIYQESCAGCHGEQGAGDGPDVDGLTLPDLTSQAFMAGKSGEDFFQAISLGTEAGMPAYADRLSESDIWAVSTYLRSLTFESPAQAAAEPAELTPSPQPEATSQQATPVAEAGQALGTITGAVVNASGGALPEDLTLTLHGFDNMQLVITQTTTLQPDGSYVFENVEMPEGRAFIVITEFSEASYNSDVGRAEPGVSSLDLPIEVFETTTDTSNLRADRLHLFFDFLDANTVRVVQLYVISNLSDKTVVPAEEGEPTARFVLPEGAANLEFQDGAIGGRYIQTEDGFGDSISIPPGIGHYEVLYAYTMPYDRKLELAQPVNLPVDAVVIMVPDEGIKIKGDKIQEGGTRDVQGAQYRVFSGQSLASGDTLEMTISGRPRSGQPTLTSGSNTSLVIGVAVFGLALILAGVWVFWRRRAGSVEEEADVEEEETLPESQGQSAESLMDAIIALDDLYQAGQLPEEAYLERRALLKARLKEMQGS